MFKFIWTFSGRYPSRSVPVIIGLLYPVIDVTHTNAGGKPLRRFGFGSWTLGGSHHFSTWGAHRDPEGDDPLLGLYSTIRVMSYNVMHKQQRPETGSCEQSTYYYCSPANLLFDNRMRKAAKRIHQSATDFVCLQEINRESVLSLRDPLNGGRKLFEEACCLFHTGTSSSDGCAIFFRPDKYECLGSYSFRLGFLASKYFPHFLTDHLSPAEQNLGRDLKERVNVCILASFRLRQNSAVVHVANTHLYWNPVYEDIKLLQAYILAKEVNAYLTQFSQQKEDRSEASSPSLILAGDFNSLPELIEAGRTNSRSGVYELLTTGSVLQTHAHHPARLRSGIQKGFIEDLYLDHPPFKSAYNEVNGKEPAFTHFVPKFRGCLDYIFYCGDSLRAASAEALPRLDRLSDEVALPNTTEASDHLPLTVTFVHI